MLTLKTVAARPAQRLDSAFHISPARAWHSTGNRFDAAAWSKASAGRVAAPMSQLLAPWAGGFGLRGGSRPRPCVVAAAQWNGASTGATPAVLLDALVQIPNGIEPPDATADEVFATVNDAICDIEDNLDTAPVAFRTAWERARDAGVVARAHVPVTRASLASSAAQQQMQAFSDAMNQVLVEASRCDEALFFVELLNQWSMINLVVGAPVMPTENPALAGLAIPQYDLLTLTSGALCNELHAAEQTTAWKDLQASAEYAALLRSSELLVSGVEVNEAMLQHHEQVARALLAHPAAAALPPLSTKARPHAAAWLVAMLGRREVAAPLCNGLGDVFAVYQLKSTQLD